MNKFRDSVEEICKKDKRYKPDAYEFVMLGLNFTQEQFKGQPQYKERFSSGKAHISGSELARGLRDYAINQYGALAGNVLSHWGISRTQDFGNIVFTMIEKKFLSKSETDSLADFNDVYDFKAAFANVLADSVIKGLGEQA